MNTAAQTVIIVVTFGLAAYVIRSLRQIHSLVNSRLTEALKEIKRLGGESTDF